MVKPNQIKCQKCGFSDTRALQKHHVLDEKGRRTGAVVWLCANCHLILHDHRRRGTLEPEYAWLERWAQAYLEELISRHSWEHQHLLRSYIMALNILANRFIELGGKINFRFHSEDADISEILKEIKIGTPIKAADEPYFCYRALSLIIDLLITAGVNVVGRISGGGGTRLLGARKSENNTDF